ncbi:MAG: Ig-like domain-containing protein [Myxococcales bacterium]|nr:Ig-like domain-containing protein [Myxococcales bacterium]
MFQLSLLFGLVAACQSPEFTRSDRTPTTESPRTEPTPAPRTTPAEGPTVVSISPEEGWINVAPLANVRITFDQPLDESSVSSAQAVLRDGGERILPVTVMLDRNNTVIVDPDVPLPLDDEITLELSGISSSEGLAAQSVSVGFHTHYGVRVERGWSETSADLRSFDQGLRGPTRIVRFRDPGRDRTWFTDDDLIDYYSESERDDLGRSLGDWFYREPGADGEWMTADDRVDSHWTWEYVGDTVTFHLVRDPGDDGVFGTTDDRPGHSYRRTSVYAPHLVRREMIYSVQPGPDGVWFTGDDHSANAEVTTFTVAGQEDEFTAFDSPGPDRIWLTADDRLSSLRTREHAAPPTEHWQLERSHPGPDGTWRTDDDTIKSFRRHVLDSIDRTVREETCTDPGEDGVWMTADDTIAEVTVFERDADGLLLREGTTRAPGPDGIWATPDDTWFVSRSYTYGAEGHRTQMVTLWDSELNTSVYLAPEAAGPPPAP